MIRVLSIFGTRPEAIKMAPVIGALQRRAQQFESVVCVSAQHREMLDQVMRIFSLQADYDLDLMTPDQSPSQVVSRVLDKMPALLCKTVPDVVLVQGDTVTTFAAALAAYLQKIPVAHVEAGLRTGDRYHPFPEEMNRQLATRLATLHFAPTEKARRTLIAEGVPAKNVYLTGNTVIDALLQTVRGDYQFAHPKLAGLDSERRVILVTTHRRESFEAPLRSICQAIGDLAGRLSEYEFVVPVHQNPNVKKTVVEILGRTPNVLLIEPLGYLEFVHLMARAYLILTDSGGIQEEAPSLDKPVLVLRDVTERPEGVESGAAKLIGTDRETIITSSLALLNDASRYAQMAQAPNPYGDGKASERIVAALLQHFNAARPGATSDRVRA